MLKLDTSSNSAHPLTYMQPLENVKISEEECLQIGGHCYEDSNIVLTSNPPKYIRRCKHCGKQQIGTPRDSMDWNDW